MLSDTRRLSRSRPENPCVAGSIPALAIEPHAAATTGRVRFSCALAQTRRVPDDLPMSRAPDPPRRNTPVTPLFLNAREESAKPRVLIVDDQIDVATAIASLLATRGYDAVTAPTGPAALQKLRGEYFDVLLCDVRMPEMSGLELLTQALLLDRDLPVLMLTGVNDVATARDALARGAMDYLTKPIELDDLDQAIRSAARHHRSEIKRKSGPHAVVSDKAVPDKVELRGGPLAGRLVHLNDRRFRLWVAAQPDGEHVWASIEAPTGLPDGTHVQGCYEFSEKDGALHWTT